MPELVMVFGPLVMVFGPLVTVFEATDGFWSAARALPSGGISRSAGRRVHSFASASRCASETVSRSANGRSDAAGAYGCAEAGTGSARATASMRCCSERAGGQQGN